MDQSWTDILARHKRSIAIISVIITLSIIGLIIYKIVDAMPVNLEKADLSDASLDKKEKAAAQMTITIDKLPASVDDETKAYLENQLAFILRQKHGAEATRYTATVRQVIGYNDAMALSLYVDVPEANETYFGYINVTNKNGSFVCAPQDQQIDPSTSECTDVYAGDETNFPNG